MDTIFRNKKDVDNNAMQIEEFLTSIEALAKLPEKWEIVHNINNMKDVRVKEYNFTFGQTTFFLDYEISTGHIQAGFYRGADKNYSHSIVATDRNLFSPNVVSRLKALFDNVERRVMTNYLENQNNAVAQLGKFLMTTISQVVSSSMADIVTRIKEVTSTGNIVWRRFSGSGRTTNYYSIFGDQQVTIVETPEGQFYLYLNHIKDNTSQTPKFMIASSDLNAQSYNTPMLKELVDMISDQMSNATGITLSGVDQMLPWINKRLDDYLGTRR